MTAPDQQLALIGCGNMGCALLGGLIRGGWQRAQLVGADPDAARRKALETQLGVRALPDNIEACRDAGVLVLAVKPQQIRQVACALAPCLEARAEGGPLIVSLVAGIPLRALEQWLGPGLAIVRTMPNTPCLLGRGASGLLANRQVGAPERQLAETLMQSVGLALWFDSDAELDAVCAISGCGPAYFFLIMEAMEQAAVEMGLAADKARALVLATAEGAALLAREQGAAPGTLRQEVSSPGGCTEQALGVLQEGQLQALFSRALRAAQARAAQMAREAEQAGQ